MKRKLLKSALLTGVLALLAAPAWSLGLGQLKLKSKLNEPLLAEIPIISSDPGELENLHARLAAPETFLRVGLPLPDKMVSDLRFALAYDTEGKPFIRVTSPGPVALPMMTFLLEVDWGDGRLVREYSVLVQAPEAVAAASQREIEAPIAAPSITIERDAIPAAPTPEATSAPAPSRVTASISASAAVPASTASSTLAPVRAGQSLSAIAAGLRQPGQSLDAVMAALLRDNPQAFINGNPNLLRQGAVLQAPDAAAIDAARSDGTLETLNNEIARWRNRHARQAVDVASDAAPASETAAAPRASVATAATRDARLEITPAASAATTSASNRSGSGGEGDAEMAQQLQEAHETIATRDAEVAELKSRVEELENLQKQQAQLIQMKDSELAAAQGKMAQANTAEPAVQSGGVMLPLVLAAAAVLAVLAALGYWLRGRGRRGKPASDTPSFVRDTAAAAPAPLVADVTVEPPAELPSPAELLPPEPANDHQDQHPATGPTGPAPAPIAIKAPSWVSGVRSVEPLATQPAQRVAWSFPSDGGVAAIAASAGSVSDSIGHGEGEPMPNELPEGKGVFDFPEAAELEPLAVESSAFEIIGQDVFAPDVAELDAAEEAAEETEAFESTEDERLALARTYLELGDQSTARNLLRQVIADGAAEHATHAQLLLDRMS